MTRGLLAILCACCLAAPLQAQRISPETRDALVHVVAHEIGHAVLREFDLPILGPEEAIADDFATVYVHTTFPDRAEAIVTARARQNLADGEEAGAFSEYVDDDRRAGRAVCLLHGLDPDRYAGLPDRFGIPEDAARTCRDFGPEVLRSWRRVLGDYRMPEDARVTEAFVSLPDGPLGEALEAAGFRDDAYRLLAGIDWHSAIRVAVDACGGGASFSRNGRRITICAGYVERFERQLGG